MLSFFCICAVHTFVLKAVFQSVKDIKFESNSQQVVNDARRYRGCFQSVKDIKFESNSQPSLAGYFHFYSCFQSVKDIKFESNSQPAGFDSFYTFFNIFPHGREVHLESKEVRLWEGSFCTF